MEGFLKSVNFFTFRCGTFFHLDPSLNTCQVSNNGEHRWSTFHYRLIKFNPTHKCEGEGQQLVTKTNELVKCFNQIKGVLSHKGIFLTSNTCVQREIMSAQRERTLEDNVPLMSGSIISSRLPQS